MNGLFKRAPQPIELRPFQDKMVQETRAALRSHNAVLLQLPTGGGKTVVSSFMMGSAVRKGGRAWFICHRDFLVDQTSLTLERVGVDHAFIAAGRRWNPYANAQICGIDTLKGKLDRIPPEAYPTVAFVDEGHHACSPTWARVIRWLLERGCKIVALSATPKRLDRKGLDELFGAMIQGPSLAWLIENKYLSQYHAFAPSMPDLDSISSRAGDYKTEELEEEMDKDALVGDMVAHYRRIADGKRAVYFCVSIKHSQHVAAAFRSVGISAVHLDGSSPSDERRSAARGMAIGEIDVICNVNLFGEGYDLAAQAGMDVTIECVGMARPTKSLAMYMQQVGRALRPKDTPAIILDHAGNIITHGLPDDDREWTLAAEGPKKRKGLSAAPDPIKVCPNCFATAAANSRVCTFCGEAFPVRGDKMPNETDDELQPVDKVALRAARAQQEHACKSLDDLVAVGRARGYSKPEAWAAHMWTARQRSGNKRAEEAARQHKMW